MRTVTRWFGLVTLIWLCVGWILGLRVLCSGHFVRHFVWCIGWCLLVVFAGGELALEYCGFEFCLYVWLELCLFVVFALGYFVWAVVLLFGFGFCCLVWVWWLCIACVCFVMGTLLWWFDSLVIGLTCVA